MNNNLKTTLQFVLRSTIRRFLVIFLLLALILGGILAWVYYLEVRNDRAVTESHEIQSLDHQVDTIKNEFQSILSDLMYLSEQNDLLEMIESGEAFIPSAYTTYQRERTNVASVTSPITNRRERR